MSASDILSEQLVCVSVINLTLINFNLNLIEVQVSLCVLSLSSAVLTCPICPALCI